MKIENLNLDNLFALNKEHSDAKKYVDNLISNKQFFEDNGIAIDKQTNPELFEQVYEEILNREKSKLKAIEKEISKL